MPEPQMVAVPGDAHSSFETQGLHDLLRYHDAALFIGYHAVHALVEIPDLGVVRGVEEAVERFDMLRVVRPP
jgi:hypothetical protein